MISGAWVLLIGAVLAVALVAAVVQEDAGDVDVFEIGVGECFDEPSGDAAMRITVVPCAEPHFAETFAEFDVAGDTYPGDEEIVLEADQGCIDRFEEFVGLSYADSVYDVFVLHPNAGSWRPQDDRAVLCAVFDPAGQTTVPTLRNAQN